MQILLWKPEKTVLHQKRIYSFSYIILLSKYASETLCFLVRCTRGPCTNETGYSLYWLECHTINSDPYMQRPCLKSTAGCLQVVTALVSAPKARVQQLAFSLWSSRNGCTHSCMIEIFRWCCFEKLRLAQGYIVLLPWLTNPTAQVSRSNTQISHSKGTYKR